MAMLTKPFSLRVQIVTRSSKQQGSKHKNRASNKPKKTLNRAPSHIEFDGLMYRWEKLGGNKIKYMTQTPKGKIKRN